MICSRFAGKNYGLIYCIITKISFARKPKRPSSMDRAAKIVIQTIITFRTSLWILKEKGKKNKKASLLGVAKVKYDAGFVHRCKRLHLISRNHKIFWRRETRSYVFSM